MNDTELTFHRTLQEIFGNGCRTVISDEEWHDESGYGTIWWLCICAVVLFSGIVLYFFW